MPDRQHPGDAETGRQPTAAEIGGDAGRFVEQEQEGEGEKRIAERKKCSSTSMRNAPSVNVKPQ